MFKDPGMTIQPPEQPDDLERLFAAEEAAIRDGGFSKRVVEQARGGIGWRRTAIYGSAMAGFGVAVAGIIDLAPYLPNMTTLWSGVVSDVQAAAAPTGNGALLAIAALVAGVSFLLVAVTAQDR